MNDDLSQQYVLQIEGNPLKNKNAILLEKQTDGNWRGFMWKDDKLVQARQSDPGIVLQLLLTHE